MERVDSNISTAESAKLLWGIESRSKLLHLMSNRLDDLSKRSSSLAPIYSVSLPSKLSTFASENVSYCRDFTQRISLEVKTSSFSDEAQL